MENIALLVSIVVAALFIPMMFAWFVQKQGKNQDYLRSVERKYSIPPLNLKG